MRCLIAETVALKPHLETAGEIALTLREQGHTPIYSWLGDALPWSDWQLPRVARLLGCSLARREQRFSQLLAQHGVTIAPKPDITQRQTIRAWAQSFSGDLDALQSYRYGGAALGMGAASSLISLYGDSLYDPRTNLPEVRRCLESAALVFERAKRVIAQEKPDQLITFNGRFATAKPIVCAAEMAGIPVLRHERGATLDRYALYSDAVHNYAYIRTRIHDAWQQADSVERESLGHAFFKRRREGDGIGWYSYTAEQDQGRIPARSGKRRVVFFSSSDDEYACATDAFDRGPWPSQLAAVATLQQLCNAQPDLELILRIHPHLAKKSSGEQARWLALSGPGIHVISPHEKVDSYALLDSADIVASYGSTIGMEAAYWGKPSLLLGPGSYVGSPAVTEPKTADELAHALQPGNATPKPQAHCLPYGHYYLTYGTHYRFYQPRTLSDGAFLGDRLGWDPAFVYRLRQHKAVNALFRALHKRK